MNLPKSSRYHRAKRRAEGLACLLALGLLAALVLTPASVTLRTLAGGSVAAYAGVLLVLHELLQLPLSGYRGWRLERQYQLSDVTVASWLGGQLKTGPVRAGRRRSSRRVRLLDDALAERLVGRCRRRKRRRRRLC